MLLTYGFAVMVLSPLATLLLRQMVLLAAELAERLGQKRHDMKFIAGAVSMVFTLALWAGIVIGVMGGGF